MLFNSSSIWSIWEKKTFQPNQNMYSIKFLETGFWTRCCVWFDLMWCACMTLVTLYTNKVCLIPHALTRWMGHVTAPVIICNAKKGFPSHSSKFAVWTACGLVLGSSGSSFPWLLITACCGICFRRIMFPILTTALSSPEDLYNFTDVIRCLNALTCICWLWFRYLQICICR